MLYEHHIPRKGIDMNVLVACEESQRVCIAFRERGHNAFSCDIEPCSGGHPEWHIMQDVIPLLDGRCNFKTMDGIEHSIDGKWDLIIAFPPCTHLAVSGAAWFEKKRNDGRQKDAIEFFCQFLNADCDKICIENPVGYMNTKYRKPDQIVHPYWFAKDENDEENYQLKRTCFWLKNLDPLPCNKNMKHPEPMYICDGEKCKGKKIYWCEGSRGNKGGQAARAKARSKTFPAIATAMADTWG